MFISECVENKMAFKPDQKDESGNPLPLGSIEVRIGSHESNLGQIRTVYARPAVWSRRIPLIGEQVILISAPVNDWSTSGIKGVGFLYLSPINASDDLVIHKFPKLWKRKSPGQNTTSAERKSDKKENHTFPEKPKRTENLQMYEGDDLFEGRCGASIRFSTTIKGGDMSVYSQKPTWDGTGNGDPIMVLRIKKPEAPPTNSAESAEINNNKYTVEDIEKDESSIYFTSNQKLSKFKAGFDKNTEAKKIGNFGGKSQIAINSNRVVLNANKDMLLLIGKEKVIVTGKKVLFQSDKYKVDLDELMDFLKKWLGEDVKLTSASANFSTPAGPTGPATSMAQFVQLQSSDFTKFKQP